MLVLAWISESLYAPDGLLGACSLVILSMSPSSAASNNIAGSTNRSQPSTDTSTRCFSGLMPHRENEHDSDSVWFSSSVEFTSLFIPGIYHGQQLLDLISSRHILFSTGR